MTFHYTRTIIRPLAEKVAAGDAAATIQASHLSYEGWKQVLHYAKLEAGNDRDKRAAMLENVAAFESMKLPHIAAVVAVKEEKVLLEAAYPKIYPDDKIVSAEAVAEIMAKGRVIVAPYSAGAEVDCRQLKFIEEDQFVKEGALVRALKYERAVWKSMPMEESRKVIERFYVIL